MDQKVTYGLIGGIVGALLIFLLTNYSVNNRNYGMMRMMGMDRGMQTMMRGDECPMEREDNVGMGMSMNEMTRNLVTLKGEEFDKVFIETMTEHHQGAIDMANLIPGRSDRSELKTLGENIISAQSKEIEMMKGWLKTWFQ